MLIPSRTEIYDKHMAAREGMTRHFNDELEKILVKNSSKGTYWILGKAKIHKHKGVDVVRPFLQACDEKPGVIKDSFVYEVDNSRGVKTLLWVMHPGGLLSFPTLGKSIRVSDEKGAPILTPK